MVSTEVVVVVVVVIVVVVAVLSAEALHNTITLLHVYMHLHHLRIPPSRL